ncbi:hypothetical protein GH714_026078 [Hevea brasiliensis]|uniref:Uncharacterized protein n=1 Tax=Hevea brasiliensis TaxID=3981 RepID=A0A6A6LEI5_HEVBR|nr:hypothetical protein GH714_026078 [Hevea brasiliensis]
MSSVDPTIAPMVSSATTSHQAWQRLITTYANRSQACIYGLLEGLSRLSKDDKSVTQYLREIRSLVNVLILTGSPLGDAELIIKILSGLGFEFKDLSAAVHAHDIPITFEELFDKLSAMSKAIILEVAVAPQHSMELVILAMDLSPISLLITATHTINSNMVGALPTIAHNTNYEIKLAMLLKFVGLALIMLKNHKHLLLLTILDLFCTMDNGFRSYSSCHYKSTDGGGEYKGLDNVLLRYGI